MNENIVVSSSYSRYLTPFIKSKRSLKLSFIENKLWIDVVFYLFTSPCLVFEQLFM